MATARHRRTITPPKLTVACALSLAMLRKEFFTIGEPVRLQKEAEKNGAVRRHRLVLIASRPPDELARSALAFMILKRSFDHVSLLERSMFVQRHDCARLQLEECGGDAVIVGIEHFDLNAWKFGLLPRHAGSVDIMCGAFRWIFRLDIGVHDFAGWRGHRCLLG